MARERRTTELEHSYIFILFTSYIVKIHTCAIYFVQDLVQISKTLKSLDGGNGSADDQKLSSAVDDLEMSSIEQERHAIHNFR